MVWGLLIISLLLNALQGIQNNQRIAKLNKELKLSRQENTENAKRLDVQAEEIDSLKQELRDYFYDLGKRVVNSIEPE